MYNFKTKSLVTMLLITTTVFSQGTNFDDDVQDVPVNEWLWPIFLIGIVFGAWYLQKNTSIQK